MGVIGFRRYRRIGLLVLGVGLLGCGLAPVPVLEDPYRRTGVRWEDGGCSGIGDLYLPRERRRGGPLVVAVHGGQWRFGSRAEWRDSLIVDELTRRGIAVLAVEYRLSIQAPWPAQIDDVRAAVRWARREGPRWSLSGSRIGLLGTSAGGHLASLAALSDDPAVPPGGLRVRVFATVSGESDLTVPAFSPREPDLLALLFGHQPSPGELREASPVQYARAGVSAFVAHSELDGDVYVDQADRLVGALLGCASDVWFLRRRGGDHGQDVIEDPAVARQLASFFHSRL